MPARFSRLCLAIGIMTLASGLALVVAPGFALNLLDVTNTSDTRYLFRIVGMFTGLFGGVLTAAVRSRAHEDVALIWCVLQKTGAFVAMATGFILDVFGPLGLVVAVVDGLSGILVSIHRQSRQRQSHKQQEA